MEDTAARAIAIVGVGAVLPDAPNAPAFWDNVKAGRYSVRDVPPARWDPQLYYDPDPKAPDKTYSRIGGFVHAYEWDPVKWKVAIPPRVADAMDDTQKWAVACTRQVLADYGYPQRPLDTERTAVILGTAMAGERHYVTAMRIAFPELARKLGQAASFEALPAEVRAAVQREFHERVACELPAITEDTMPGELANCVAGRVANLFNLRGPNYICDAACASALAAIDAATEGLIEGEFDAVVTGGIDRNMGASTYVKFCKIGALSATGTRPYADGADGFVMGEGAALFLLKRLADAERAGDRIYAVLRGMGGASDGRGKGITAPNPVGQRLAIERGWRNAGLDPATVSLVEGHGTSTRVGDVVEVQSLIATLGGGLRPGSVPLGSVKSNIGHLKGAAGAAGLLKAACALHDKVLPPSLNFARPNPNIDFASAPFFVNTELREWPVPACGVRRAALSAFGFGGTNFHLVLEEHVPGRLTGNGLSVVGAALRPALRHSNDTDRPTATGGATATAGPKTPLRGALVLGAPDVGALAERVRTVAAEARAGRAPDPAAPLAADLRAPERLALDYANATDLAEKATKVLKALDGGAPALWRALRNQGVFRGRGPAPKVAFLYPGQGSQYVDMARELRAREPLVAAVFDEADRVMAPLLGRPLSGYLFVDGGDEAARARAEEDLQQTAITQPAVLAVDIALTRLLEAYGVAPDMVMGHSLGEYGALVAAGVLTFADALEAVSARGREMTRVSMADNGRMAAVMAPIEEIERVLAGVGDDVVVANYNSTRQAVIGGATPAVEAAVAALRAVGHNVVPLHVSHAFHTRIVAPASEPLRRTLERLGVQAPRLPVVANVDGAFYPTGAGAREQALDILARQVAAPVQFVQGLRTLRAAGARVFVEVGPKKALHGFVEDVFADDPDVLSLFTNHPKLGDVVAFSQALCGLYAAGLGAARVEQPWGVSTAAPPSVAAPAVTRPATSAAAAAPLTAERYQELGHVFAEFLERGMAVYQGGRATAPVPDEPIVISGAGLGLPGGARVFDDDNVGRILRGDQLIGEIPARLRREMADKHVVRLVKSEAGESHFAAIDDAADVIKLAGRGGALDLEREFGLPAERVAALDVVTQLALAAGLEALRDAGIPLVMRYKTTTRGTQLHDRWGLPEALRDDTGVIFASAFPGYDAFASDLRRYHLERARRERLDDLLSLRAQLAQAGVAAAALAELDRRAQETRAALEQDPFVFDRRFLFRILSMGHSQFAELVGARGPNTQINAACASTTQGLTLAEDWIRAGRCRRVVLISGDDVSSDNLMEWIGAGFLATGAAATDATVETAALPFDRRRHGMIVGMGAAALVVESAAAARERGVAPICEVLAATTANSAYHGTRLNVNHISQVMERLVASAEQHWGVARAQLAPETVFVSHETYTPARGGSAAAEVFALRHVFGDDAARIVMANTKGLTGHAMGAGIEDVVAVKALETGLVPPVANFKEVDPELGALNLSRGGAYPVRYALRLAAGFGSQIALSLLRQVAPPDGRRRAPGELGFAYRVADPAVFAGWLARLSGYPQAQLEVVQRTLRIKDQGAPTSAARDNETAAVAPAPVAPAAAPVPATVAPVAPAVAPSAGDPVRDKVLALVAAKTGYPPDMLALDLDLEADLGIDTVKQAELFAAVREEWNIPRDDNRKLRDYPTLQHVIGFVHAMRPDLAAAAQTSVIATVAPAAAQALATPAVAPSAGDPVRDKVLALVAAKTGYPPDMLALDLDLEADLGIDTVKQAELFAAVREEWNIPRDDNRKLRDYPTLQHVIGFVRTMRPDLAAAVQTSVIAAVAPVAAQAPAMPAVAPSAGDPVRDKVLALVAAKTGYPPDMLDLDLDLEADLGIDTVKQAELFAAVREEWNIPRDDNRKLRDYPTLQHVIGFVHAMRPDLAAAAQTPVIAAVAPTAAQAPATPAVAPIGGDPVRAKVLALVAEKTGYPPDMLDLDLDLEADLGIDTVKQAELFAAVREEWNIPRDDNRKLRDYPTLQHVIGFVHAMRPDLAAAVQAPVIAAVAPTAAQAPATPAVAPARPALADVAAADGVPRRVPIPVLRPPLTLCKPTGVMLGPGLRVLVMSDRGGVGKALVRRLEKLGCETLVVNDAPPAEELGGRIEAWLAAGPIHGVYWLPALDPEGDLAAFDFAAWREALRLRVKLLYTTMRALYAQVHERGTFLVAATRLGGRHGYDEDGAVAPLGGAVTGFTKAYKRERPEALVKAVDFEASRKTAELAALLLDETLRDPGAVEIGYRDGLRASVALEERSARDGQPGMTLDADSVFVITGAAGGIVSAITADLAAASGGTFHLLDLVGEPDPADPDLARFTSDREGLKRDLFARLQARGERATPALVERELARLERSVAALRALEAVRAAGGRAHWCSVDLRDAEAVELALAPVRAAGRVDVLLHGAGLEVSRFLPDKAPAEFERVFDVKCDGWWSVLHALRDVPLGAAVAFSSIAGRFGNLGQSDYSAANDLLCKCVSSFRTTRPQTRGIALDWTAWGDVGMATRGSIPRMMELAGIDMLPAAVGVPVIRRELITGGTRGEVVIAGRLGAMLEEWDASGGLDLEALSGATPLLGRVCAASLYGGLVIETRLDPAARGFLHDHQIDGTPVLPGVMGIEAFAEAARLLLPGWHVAGVEQVDFLAPFKFYRHEPRALRLEILLRPVGGRVMADCSLVGERTLPGQAAPQRTTHFRARVVLSSEPPDARRVKKPRLRRSSAAVNAAQIYDVYFHGPAYRVLESAWCDDGCAVGRMATGLPADGASETGDTLMAPRVIELCFQTAGILEMGTRGQMGLPLHVAGVQLVRSPLEAGEAPLYAQVTPAAGAGAENAFDARVVDEAGHVYLELRGYRTVALPGAIEAQKLKPFQAAMA